MISELKESLALAEVYEREQQVQHPHPTAGTSSQANSTTVQDDEIWGIIDRKIVDATSQATPYSSAAIMVKQYIDLPYLGKKCDLLGFWCEKKGIFPLFYKLAQKYLCIPATSVPSERLFSKAGILCNERRNRLAPKKVNEILFLNSIPT